MTTARELMEQAAPKIAAAGPMAAQIGATFKFVLGGDGGGTWIAHLKDPPSLKEADGDADCTLKLAASDYVDLMEGKTPPQGLFFAGKLQIEGDMALAMKLADLTALLR